MKYYSHDDVYSSLEAITPLSIEQIEVAMNSLTPVTSPNRERIRMDLWREFASISINKADEALAAFDKQFPK